MQGQRSTGRIMARWTDSVLLLLLVHTSFLKSEYLTETRDGIEELKAFVQQQANDIRLLRAQMSAMEKKEAERELTIQRLSERIVLLEKGCAGTQQENNPSMIVIDSKNNTMNKSRVKTKPRQLNHIKTRQRSSDLQDNKFKRKQSCFKMNRSRKAIMNS